MKEEKIKAIRCASLLFGLIMCFSSCDAPIGDIGESTSGEEDTVESVLEESGVFPKGAEWVIEGTTLEPDKQKLPTYDTLCKIKPDMTLDEVYAIAGNPQRNAIIMVPQPTDASSFSQEICSVYDSCDGDSIAINWGKTKPEDGGVWEIIVKNTIKVTKKTDDETSGDQNAHIPTLEPDKKDLPTFAELCTIKYDMTPNEVYSIAGNPQRIIIMMVTKDPWSSLASPAQLYVYGSCDGNSVAILYTYSETEQSEPTAHQIYEIVAESEE